MNLHILYGEIMKRWLLFLGILVPFYLKAAGPGSPWVVYYGSEANSEVFQPYSLVILDSDSYPTLEPLKESGKTLLGYLSLGSVSNDRSWYPKAKEAGVIIKEDKNFPKSYTVDVRNPRWMKQVIEQVIPQILHKGFDGLFIDTLDNPLELERENPRQYGGMKGGAAKLIQTIRLHYPQIPIMMNRAYEILPEVAGDINFELSESDITTYNFKNKTYSWEPKEKLDKVLAAFARVKKANADLRFFALNFWDPKEPEQIKKIYQRSRDSGLDPYVGTIDLNKVVPEPR